MSTQAYYKERLGFDPQEAMQDGVNGGYYDGPHQPKCHRGDVKESHDQVYEENLTKFKGPDPEGQPVKYGLGVRHVQAFLYFICLTLAFIASGHMGVTIVAMTIVGNKTVATDPDIQTKDYLGNSKSFESISENDTSVHDMNGSMDIYKTYDWPKSVQEIILGSYVYGASIMMFPSGLICQRWGGKVLLQFTMIVNGVASIVMPWCVPWEYQKLDCTQQSTHYYQIGFLSANEAHLAATFMQVNYTDLSPNFCGALIATGSTLGSIMTFLMPVITSYIVTDVTNQYQWRIMMLLWAGCTTIGDIIYIFFMSTEIQPWNTGGDEKDTKKT